MQYKYQLAARTQKYHRVNGVALQESYCGTKGIACLDAKDAWWHYGGEWAIYSCAMLSAELVNISRIYPEERERAIKRISSLIDIVLSPELREYDTHWFREDTLSSIDGIQSHMTCLSLLAWMITYYKQAGGDGKYDD